LEELQCEGYYSSWGDGAKICQEYKKKQGKILVVTMCLSSGSFETLQAKTKSNSN